MTIEESTQQPEEVHVDWTSVQSIVAGFQEHKERRTGRAGPVAARCWAQERSAADETLLAAFQLGQPVSYAPCPLHGSDPCPTSAAAGTTSTPTVADAAERELSLRLLATIDRASAGATMSAARVGFTLSETAVNEWFRLAATATGTVAAAPEPAVDAPVLFSGERWRRTARRAAVKRLPDKSGVPAYADYSSELGYPYNVGRHGAVHVGFAGWYIMTSGGPGGLPLARAQRIAQVEQLGASNWVSPQAFTLPEFSGLVGDVEEVLSSDGWAQDPALVSALWSAHYHDRKRAMHHDGRWPRPSLAYRHERHGWIQLIENVAFASVWLMLEQGASPQVLLDAVMLWRRLDDIFDAVTDVVTGETNNHAAELLRGWITQQPYDRVRAGQEMMGFHQQSLALQRSLLPRVGASTVMRHQTTCVAMWYQWMGRYNIWTKYLLARRYLEIPGTALPAVSWEQVDLDHIRAVYARCGASCADAMVDLACRAQNSGPRLRLAGPAASRMYTALVCAVEGIELCARRSCDCADRLAEYLDAELGGEYCQWAAELVRADRDKTDDYQAMNSYIDSEAFSVLGIGAYASGYMAPELLQMPTGSLLADCTRTSWI